MADPVRRSPDRRLSVRPLSARRNTISPIDHLHAPLVGLDIETDTSVDGLDPRRSAIVALALSTPTADLVFDHPDETELLTAADAAIADLGDGVLVTWNGAGFDLPFIAHRADHLGVGLGLTVEFDPSIPGRHDPLPGQPGRVRGRWHGFGHLDGYQAYRSDVGQTLPVSCGLKSLARFVGLPVVEVDRARIHELTVEQRRTYVASDARLARALVDRRADRAASVDHLPSSRGS